MPIESSHAVEAADAIQAVVRAAVEQMGGADAD
jgi:hypothetical protein